MAIPWVTVLQAIPWGQVIENAPKLVDGAQKLFFRLKKGEAPGSVVLNPSQDEDETARLQALEKYVQENRLELQQLHQNLSDTADLLNNLTGQNAKMVGEIDLLRKQTRRLQWVLAVVSVALSGMVLRYLVG